MKLTTPEGVVEGSPVEIREYQQLNNSPLVLAEALGIGSQLEKPTQPHAFAPVAEAQKKKKDSKPSPLMDYIAALNLPRRTAVERSARLAFQWETHGAVIRNRFGDVDNFAVIRWLEADSNLEELSGTVKEWADLHSRIKRDPLGMQKGPALLFHFDRKYANNEGSDFVANTLTQLVDGTDEPGLNYVRGELFKLKAEPGGNNTSRAVRHEPIIYALIEGLLADRARATAPMPTALAFSINGNH